MGPLRLYEVFNAMRLHWNTSYDFIKCKGKVKHFNQLTFNKSRHKGTYLQVSKKYKIEKDFVLTILPLFLEDDNTHISDLIGAESREKALAWYRKIQKMNIWYEEDCKTIVNFINEQGMSFQQFFYGNPILDFLIYEKINIETFIILNKFIFFLTKNPEDVILYKSMMKPKINNYSPFIQVDVKKYENTFNKIIQRGYTQGGIS